MTRCSTRMQEKWWSTRALGPEEGRGEDASGRAEDAGGILMRGHWRLRRAIEPRPMGSIRAMELETAKEIKKENQV